MSRMMTLEVAMESQQDVWGTMPLNQEQNLTVVEPILLLKPDSNLQTVLTQTTCVLKSVLVSSNSALTTAEQNLVLVYSNLH